MLIFAILAYFHLLHNSAHSHGDGLHHDHGHDESWRNQVQAEVITDGPFERPPLVPLYKLYSEQLKDHMFTTDAHTAFRSIPAYTYEGIAGYLSPVVTPQSPNELVAFFAAAPRNDTFMTADALEAYRMKSEEQNPYKFIGVVGYCSLQRQAGQCPLYRLYRSGDLVDHFYTTKEHDNHILADAGSVLEGVTCYVYCSQ